MPIRIEPNNPNTTVMPRFNYCTVLHLFRSSTKFSDDGIKSSRKIFIILILFIVESSKIIVNMLSKRFYRFLTPSTIAKASIRSTSHLLLYQVLITLIQSLPLSTRIQIICISNSTGKN